MVVVLGSAMGTSRCAVEAVQMVGYSDLSEMSAEISDFELPPRLWFSLYNFTCATRIGMCIGINVPTVATLL
jgi:hypothetical protein